MDFLPSRIVKCLYEKRNVLFYKTIELPDFACALFYLFKYKAFFKFRVIIAYSFGIFVHYFSRSTLFWVQLFICFWFYRLLLFVAKIIELKNSISLVNNYLYPGPDWKKMRTRIVPILAPLYSAPIVLRARCAFC